MIGRTLAHYRIEEKLGQGGMGIVYKAMDTHLDRHVAVKVLPQDMVADPERVRRFVQEAKAASALNHPNIITIYDIDESDGIHFIAMEYVEGVTLQKMVHNGQLRLNESLEYGTQIADALSKAHSAGIVHRDLKPSNIMITNENRVKVLDFGLAKLQWKEDSAESFTTLTGKGDILGTLPYMSPEQVRGLELDSRTDIFSLGVVLYQMLTGELPFRGPHAAAVLDSLLNTPTPSLRFHYPDAPDTLERTVLRATAKKPEDRYQSMQELASDLRLIRSLPKPAEPARHLTSEADSTLSTMAPVVKKRRIPSRRRFFIISAVVLFAACLLAFLFRERLLPPLGGTVLPAQIRLAVLPFSNIGASAANEPLCDGIMEILATKFNEMEQLQSTLSVVPASEIRTEKITSAARARRAFGINLALTGSVQKFGDTVLLTINLVDAKSLRQLDGRVCRASMSELLDLEEEAFSRALSMLELKLPLETRQMLNAGATRIPSAYNFYVQAVGYLVRYDLTENIDKAIQLFQKALAEDRRYALAYAGLGEACWRKFRNTKEQKWVDAALSNCARAAEIDERVAHVHITLGMIYTGIGRPEKAVAELERALAVKPKSAEAYRELGRAYEAMGKKNEAEATYRKAIRFQPDLWSCYWNLGAFYYRQAKYGPAATQFLEVIKRTPDHFGAYASLGGVYIFEGKFDEASEMFRRSLAIRSSPQAYSNLAASYILQGHASEAVPLLEKATAMGTLSYETWGNLADAYSQLPSLVTKAPAAYERAIELATKDLEINPNNSAARASRAFYLVRLGNKTRALEEIEQAGKSAPNDSNVLFWAALVCEASGDREKALKNLARAAAGGYSLAVIRAASDLVELRKDPRYQNMIENPKH
jgi:eukaryotic-like serine/threonine-protein kinase